MNELAAKKRELEREAFDKWFDQLSGDSPNILDKAAVKNLLVSLHPENPPGDEAVDRIVAEMTRDDPSASDSDGPPAQQGHGDHPQVNAPQPGHVNGSEPSAAAASSSASRTASLAAIDKDHLFFAVQKNTMLAKEQDYLDKIFNRYDEDNSGYLEPSEVRTLMQAVAQGDVMQFDSTDPAAQEAACISYKLNCIDELKKKGIINEKVWREKRANVVKRHQSVMCPRFSEKDPDEADIAFVIDQCDKNRDNKISRDELIAAMGLWRQISQNTQGEAKSQVCAVM